MRLSRAIMVMLLLHIVAVGGFFASSVLKERDLKRATPDLSTALEAEDSHVPIRTDSTDSVKQAAEKNNARPNVHVVRPGETLTLIANENGVTLEALVAANGTDTVTNGLRAGQELKLPDHSPEPVVQPASNTADALSLIENQPKATAPSSGSSFPSLIKNAHQPQDSGKFYIVGKGETIYTIAQKKQG